MQQYKRHQEKENQKRIFEEAYKEFNERYDEWYYDDCDSLPYEGCTCIECTGIRRYYQSIESRIRNNNIPSLQNLSEIIIRKILY
jgi:hypothetical protein